VSQFITAIVQAGGGVKVVVRGPRRARVGVVEVEGVPGMVGSLVMMVRNLKAIARVRRDFAAAAAGGVRFYCNDIPLLNTRRCAKGREEWRGQSGAIYLPHQCIHHVSVRGDKAVSHRRHTATVR
jgi:hypothetical protein